MKHRIKSQMNKVSTDKLGTMTDSDVESFYRNIKSKIWKLKTLMKRKYDSSMRQDLEGLQVEYCYIKREYDSRLARKVAHEDYLKSIPRREKTF
jgi:hypothetical protein